MKKIFYLSILATMLVGAFAFTAIKKYADIFKQLKIEESEAKESIFMNFQDGNLDFPRSSVITKLAIGQREAAVKEIGDYIKAYTNSPEFAERYKAAREAAKPQGAADANEKIKARIETLEHDIETTTADMRKTSGDMKKLYEMTLLEQTKEIESTEKSCGPNAQILCKRSIESGRVGETIGYGRFKILAGRIPGNRKRIGEEQTGEVS